MDTIYTWTSKLFSNIYEISTPEGRAGELSGSGWSRNSEGELNGLKVLFVAKGFFKREIMIMQPGNETPIGSILPGTWGMSARIKLKERDYQFRFDNFFHTKWSISDINEILITYSNTFKSREIVAHVKDEILILAGLYLKDYFKKRAAQASASV